MPVTSAFTIGQPGQGLAPKPPGLINVSSVYESVSSTPELTPADQGFDPAVPLGGNNLHRTIFGATAGANLTNHKPLSLFDEGQNYAYLRQVTISSRLAIGGNISWGNESLRIECNQFTGYNEFIGTIPWADDPPLAGGPLKVYTQPAIRFRQKRLFETGAGWPTRFGNAYLEWGGHSGSVFECIFFRVQVDWVYQAD